MGTLQTAEVFSFSPSPREPEVWNSLDWVHTVVKLSPKTLLRSSLYPCSMVRQASTLHSLKPTLLTGSLTCFLDSFLPREAPP